MSIFRRIGDATQQLYRRVFRRAEDPHLFNIVETLRKVPLFQYCSHGMLLDLADIMHSRSYKRDEYLFYEQDPGLGLYIVQSGRVRLLIEDEEGTIHELRHVEENELFGEISILGDFRRMETAQAVTETRVLGFFGPDVNVMAKRNPKAHTAVMTALAQHLAARHVDMVRLLAERSGKVAAMRLLDGAVRAQVPEGESPLLSS